MHCFLPEGSVAEVNSEYAPHIERSTSCAQHSVVVVEDCHEEEDLDQFERHGEEWTLLARDIAVAASSLRPHLVHLWRNIHVEKQCHDKELTTEKVGQFDSPPAHRVSDVRESERRYRGIVWLSARPGAPKGAARKSVLCVDGKDLVLLGGDDWDTELVKLPLHHVLAGVQANEPCCFCLRVRADSEYGQDTRIFVNVDSREARDRWLSALCDKGVMEHGWDSSAFYHQPRATASNRARLTTWLS